jgi:hypothetical protein
MYAARAVAIESYHMMNAREFEEALARARSPPARRRSPPLCARRPAAPGPGRSGRSGAAAGPRRPACTPPRTGGAPPPQSAPASSTGPHPSPRPPGPASSSVASSRSRAALSLHFAPPAPLDTSAGRPRRPAHAATGSPASATRGNAGPPPGHWPPPRLIPRLPAAHAPGGPAQPRPARRTTRQPSPGVTPAIEDLLVHG